MNLKLFPMICFITMATMVPSSAQASILLGAVDFELISGRSQVVEDLDFDMFISDGGVGAEPGTIIFDALTLDDFDLGLIFESNPGNDPNFNGFASFLTNGSNDVLGYVGNGGGNTISELLFFSGTPNGIDFEGFILEKYQLTVNDILLDSPGSDPNDDGMWTDIYGHFTFSVYGRPIEDNPGVVPEPASMLLFGGGMAALALRRKHK